MHSAHTGHIIRCRCDGERKKPSDSFLPFLFGTSFNIPSYAFPAARFSLTLPYEELVFTMAHCTTKNHLHRLLIYCHNDWTSVLLNIFYILQHSLFGIARVFCLLRFLPLSLFISLFPPLSLNLPLISLHLLRFCRSLSMARTQNKRKRQKSVYKGEQKP